MLFFKRIQPKLVLHHISYDAICGLECSQSWLKHSVWSENSKSKKKEITNTNTHSNAAPSIYNELHWSETLNLFSHSHIHTHTQNQSIYRTYIRIKEYAHINNSLKSQINEKKKNWIHFWSTHRHFYIQYINSNTHIATKLSIITTTRRWRRNGFISSCNFNQFVS